MDDHVLGFLYVLVRKYLGEKEEGRTPLPMA